jgi:hypothetical protein
MRLQVGNVIEVNSNKVGGQVRRGQVVEVLGGQTGQVRVAWDSGQESLFMPSGGMVRVVRQQAK